jgi:hypothetical protein
MPKPTRLGLCRMAQRLSPGQTIFLAHTSQESHSPHIVPGHLTSRLTSTTKPTISLFTNISLSPSPPFLVEYEIHQQRQAHLGSTHACSCHKNMYTQAHHAAIHTYACSMPGPAQNPDKAVLQVTASLAPTLHQLDHVTSTMACTDHTMQWGLDHTPSHALNPVHTARTVSSTQHIATKLVQQAVQPSNHPASCCCCCGCSS